MSSASWLDGRQVPSLLHSKKGEEKFLPTCVHCHVAKSMHWYIRLWWPSTVWQCLSLLLAAVLFVFVGRIGIAFGLAWVVTIAKAFAPEPEREGVLTDYFPPGVWIGLGLIFGPLVIGAGGLSLGLAGILRFFYALIRLLFLGNLRS